ncbi:MAG TPA: alcohol dehydrogenase catalytic domain-containing protein, partial [Streptosporangiaceae bacterium]|nr:alcohol dehydrogenase catalytic domain-containing protein [Streptosporangiaceae bacterium]
MGDDLFGVAAGLDAGCYPDLAGLAQAIDAGLAVPRTVLACVRAGDGDPPAAARALTARVLGLVQGFLAQERLGSSRLVVVTRGAVAAGPGERPSDLAAAAAWGLVRSAQSENPGRLVLADLPAAGSPDGAEKLAGALITGEPEVVVRDGEVLARRLRRPSVALARPSGGQPWRLDAAEQGTLEGLALVRCPEAAAPLAEGQVRVAVRAAGLNFRDVLIGLGMYPGEAAMGGEVAGTVLEAGPGVAGLAPGDRVL